VITQLEAIGIAQTVEPIACRNGGHVALTGGCLYKDGPRKDLDLVIYRHGTTPVSINGIVDDLTHFQNWTRVSCNRRVVKMNTADGVVVDLFFVEEYPAMKGEPISGGIGGAEEKELI